jgi:hypothetical protein
MSIVIEIRILEIGGRLLYVQVERHKYKDNTPPSDWYISVYTNEGTYLDDKIVLR